MSSLYSKKVMDHFRNPHNMGYLDDADGIGEVGNPACGDMMKLYIKLDDKEVITDIKFETMGCAAAIATSSMVTDLAMGKSIDEVLKITNKDVSSELGGLPAIKEHCSNLAEEAIKDAIKDYRKKQKKK